MKLLSLRPISGRNIYARFPVIRMTVDLEDLVDTPTCDIPGFNDRLLEKLPGLKKHKCCKGYEGGFVERLETGTYLAHVMEHTAIELQNMMGYNLSFGKARWDSGKSIYSLVFSYDNEYAGKKAGMLAFELMEALLQKKDLPVENIVAEIRENADQKGFGPSTDAILKSALKTEVPLLPVGQGSLIQVGYGKNSRFLQATLTPGTSCISADISCDKEITKQLLKVNQLPVPDGDVCTTYEEALRAVEHLGYPVVTKPLDGNQGKGVSLNISSDSELKQAFEAAVSFDSSVIVEKYIQGKQYRVLVVKGEVVAAARRIAAHVIGDGKSSIKQLVEKENLNPLRGNGHDRPLSRIIIDDVSTIVLNKQNLHAGSIPRMGQTVWLRENDNISTGGMAVDVTDEMHPALKSICGLAAEVIGVEVAGIDITASDISADPEISNATIIEINSAPGIRMHHYPAEGKSRNVAGEILTRLFPEPDEVRIPIVSITGTNGKTTTTRMVNAILKEAGHVVGMTSTDGVYINNKLVDKGDNTGPLSASLVLRNKSVTAAVLETARGGMIRKGLAYDTADVGIVTNISEDHLGLDGIENLDDLARAKALVIEAVRKNGSAVLNADDKYCSFMMSRAGGKVILFSTDSENPLINHHVQKEGEAILVRNNMICYAKGKEILPLVKVESIPATLKGLLQHNVQNALAAIGAGVSLGISKETIKKALMNFSASHENSPGRFNHYLVKDVNVILDYGHNTEGYKAVTSAVSRLATGNIIGVIGVPGDRDDKMIRQTGFIAGQCFDRIILKDDSDLRGRKPGEVPRVLLEGVSSGANPHLFTEYVADEAEATKKALSYARPGDWLVVFFENLDAVKEVVENAGGVPAGPDVKLNPEILNRNKTEVHTSAG